MNDILRQILDRFDIHEPYVWRLNLTEEDFHALEEYALTNVINICQKPTKESSIIAIIYIAEWYKRNYCAADKGQSNALADVNCKTLWESSGINTNVYVYQSDKGINLWQYSIFVLGGLAVRHELSRNDKFLKNLCRAFHDEDCPLEGLDDENRAIAFRQSIIRRHSIYEFLRKILNGESSFVDEQLIVKIKSANDEVLRQKFTLEWIVNYTPSAETMARQLRVWLKPEENGGGQHQYLRYDRIHIWGIPNPEKMRNLFIGLLWYQDDLVVSDFNKQMPFIVYSNSGDGFVSWGVERYANFRNVPSCEFTHIDIVAFDDNSNEWVAQQLDIPSYMQLWRDDECEDVWSSRKSSQHQTAVIYNNSWSANIKADDCKPFRSRLYGPSALWNWNYITSDITICDNNGYSKTLYNNQGYDQVYACLHNDTILFHEGGLIKYSIEDEEEGFIEKWYPLIFGKDDIRVHHFLSKEDKINGDVETDEACDKVEIKRGSRYIQWTDYDNPNYGVVDLRVTVKNVQHSFTAAYIKGFIERDVKQNIITYYDIKGNVQTYQDTIVLNKKPLTPTITIRIGDFDIEVYRPTNIKEIYFDGCLHSYCSSGTDFVVPFILKDRVEIADYSSDGYRKYSCSNWSSIFATFKGEDNQIMDNILNETVWDATMLDENAPQWLKVALTFSNNKNLGTLPFFKCNILKDSEPEMFMFEEGYKKVKGETFFMDMNNPDDQLTCVIPKPCEYGPFDTKRLPKGIELTCFELAVRYCTYFSVFRPLRTLGQNNKDKVNEILITELKRARGGILTESDKKGVRRFAEEFSLDIDRVR